MLSALPQRFFPVKTARSFVWIAMAVVGIGAVACSTAAPGAASDADGGQPPIAPGPATAAAGNDFVSSNEAAPSFVVETFNHGTYELDATIGRPVLINFWFPSCPPCRAELPDLQAAFEEFGDEVDFIGVQQLGIDNPAEGKAFLADLGITYPNFADERLKTQIAYNVFSYPTTFFLDRGHGINREWTGLLNEKTLREQIEAIIDG